MRIRSTLFVGVAMMLLPQAAQAACSHNGISYSVGATICSGGWLQECTPAGYWKAIGQCLRDDAGRNGIGAQSPIAGESVMAWLVGGERRGFAQPSGRFRPPN